jgi:hypothetical protein
MQAPIPPASNVVGSVSDSVSGFMSSWTSVIVIVLVLFVLLVIYSKMVGYYVEIGWSRLLSLLSGGTQVDIEMGDDAQSDKPVASLKQMDAPPSLGLPPASERTPGLPGATNSSIFPSFGGAGGQVFNVSRNIYTYGDASAVCSAMNAELATFEQVRDAQEKGADWCNYGWVKGQMAVFPTSKDTYEKLQKGPAEYRNACGKPGVNGGFFDNPDLRFGVNCFGPKPSQNATSELNDGVDLPPTAEMIEYDKKVQRFREQLTTTTVLPFRRGQWEE